MNQHESLTCKTRKIYDLSRGHHTTKSNHFDKVRGENKKTQKETTTHHPAKHTIKGEKSFKFTIPLCCLIHRKMGPFKDPCVSPPPRNRGHDQHRCHKPRDRNRNALTPCRWAPEKNKKKWQFGKGVKIGWYWPTTPPPFLWESLIQVEGGCSNKHLKWCYIWYWMILICNRIHSCDWLLEYLTVLQTLNAGLKNVLEDMQYLPTSD